MRTVFLVLSFPTPQNVVLFSPCTNDRYWILIQQNGNYVSDLSYNGGYTDTILNKLGVFDNKFHVFLATGMNWGDISPILYFGAYNNSPTNFSYNSGTRIAAIGIFNRVITTTEINTIQTWFNSKNFNG